MKRSLAFLPLVLIAAAPLPPSVEKIGKEGILVTREAIVIQGAVTAKEQTATHLIRLFKDQLYSFEFKPLTIGGFFSVEDLDGKKLSIDPASFKADKDGTYRVRVSFTAGMAAKYLLTLKQLPPTTLPPGVHVVGAGGLKIDSAINQNDPADKVRRNPCKTYDVKFEAGKTYTIDMKSRQLDSYLRLEDAAGKQLAFDDDSGGNLDARIIFRAQPGIYRVFATTFGRGFGDFNLTVTEK